MKSRVEVDWSGVKWKVFNALPITFWHQRELNEEKHIYARRADREALSNGCHRRQNGPSTLFKILYYEEAIDVIDKPISAHFIVCHLPTENHVTGILLCRAARSGASNFMGSFLAARNRTAAHI